MGMAVSVENGPQSTAKSGYTANYIFRLSLRFSLWRDSRRIVYQAPDSNRVIELIEGPNLQSPMLCEAHLMGTKKGQQNVPLVL